MFPSFRCLWPLSAIALVGCSKLSPPPDVDKTAETVKGSASRGSQFAERAAETAADPDKRRQAWEKAKQDVQNPPRQFK
jgi:hypothetical protein